MVDFFVCPHCLETNIIDNGFDTSNYYYITTKCNCFISDLTIIPWNYKDKSRKWHHNPDHFVSFI